MTPEPTSYTVPTDLKRFEKLQQTRQRTFNHLNFLLECRRRKLIPNFISLDCSTTSSRIQSVIYRSRFAVLRAVIKDTRSKLARLEKSLYSLHLSLSNQLDPIIWQIVNDRCMTKVFYEGINHRRQQRTKLDRLIQDRKPKPTSSDIKLNDPIVNLSSKNFTDSQKQVLSLGLNFSISTAINIKKTVIDTECALKRKINETTQVPVTDTDLARSSIQENLKNPPTIKPNLSRNELSSLKELTKDEEIFITKADKGGQIAVINRSDYVCEVQNLLKDSSYKPTPKDISNKTLKKVKDAVKNSTFLNGYEKSMAVPSSAIPARIYALPKVHKQDISYRPIVSGIGTATYNLASTLAKKLSYLTAHNTHTVKNSEEFISKVKQLKTSPATLLVSFDVKSLFTKVPLSGALECLKTRLIELSTSNPLIDEIMNLVSICTESTQFQFQDELYLQTEGLAMGNPLSPILADIYMHYFETKMLANATVTLDTWIRYVDDVFSTWNLPRSELDSFLTYINDIDPNIQFTIEVGTTSLPFLDVNVMKTGESLSFTVYRKPFAVNLPIHKRSTHPWSHKMAAFYCFVRRALIICSNNTFLEAEISYLKTLAHSRGYNPNIIDTALEKFQRQIRNRDDFYTTLQNIQPAETKKYAKVSFHPSTSSSITSALRKCNIQPAFCPSKTIATSLQSTKDRIPHTDRWGIYKIPCNCGLAYIGQTRRKLSIRAKEHLRHAEKQQIDKSAIALHSFETGHAFDFQNAKILYTPSYYSQLDISETVYIRSNLDSLVNSNVMPYLHYSWNDILTSTS